MEILFTIYAIMIFLCGIFITAKRNILKISQKKAICYDIIIGIVVIITICAILTKNTWWEFFSLILGVIITFLINRILVKSMKGQ